MNEWEKKPPGQKTLHQESTNNNNKIIVHNLLSLNAAFFRGALDYKSHSTLTMSSTLLIFCFKLVSIVPVPPLMQGKLSLYLFLLRGKAAESSYFMWENLVKKNVQDFFLPLFCSLPRLLPIKVQYWGSVAHICDNIKYGSVARLLWFIALDEHQLLSTNSIWNNCMPFSMRGYDLQVLLYIYLNANVENTIFYVL